MEYQCPWCYKYTACPTGEMDKNRSEVLKCTACGKTSYKPPEVPKEKWDEFFQQQQSAVQAQ